MIGGPPRRRRVGTNGGGLNSILNGPKTLTSPAHVLLTTRIAEAIPAGAFVTLSSRTETVGGGGSGRNSHQRAMAMPQIRTMSSAIRDFFIRWEKGSPISNLGGFAVGKKGGCQSSIIAYSCFPFSWRSRFANQPAAPILNRRAIRVIVVSCRSRRAILSFGASPLRRTNIIN